MFSGVDFMALCRPLSFSSSSPTLLNHVFMEIMLCTGVLSNWNRFGPLSSTKGTLQYYNIQRHPVQLCATIVGYYVLTVFGRHIYGYDDQVSTNLCPHSVFNALIHWCNGSLIREKTDKNSKSDCGLSLKYRWHYSHLVWLWQRHSVMIVHGQKGE